MWDLIVSVPDHCLSFYYENIDPRLARGKNHLSNRNLPDFTTYHPSGIFCII